MSWRDCPHCGKVAEKQPELGRAARVQKRLFQMVMRLKSYRSTCAKGDGWALNYERIKKADEARAAFEDVLAAVAVEARAS